MVTQERGALASLLFGVEGFTLLDVKAFRGDDVNVTEDDIQAAIHDGLMQHKLNPKLATTVAPATGVIACDMVEFVKGLPVAA